MTQVIKNITLMVVATLLLCCVALAPATTTSAQDIKNSVCSGAADLKLSGNTQCTAVGSNQDDALDRIIRQVINIFSLIVGVVAVIMIIIGGFRYITSGGDSNNVGGAKNTIIYAIVGLIIVALAQVIVRFVLGKATTG